MRTMHVHAATFAIVIATGAACGQTTEGTCEESYDCTDTVAPAGGDAASGDLTDSGAGGDATAADGDATATGGDAQDGAPPGSEGGPSSCGTAQHLCAGACVPNTDTPTDDACVVSEEFGVFVSRSLGSPSGDGSRAKPYSTLAAGIAAAAGAGKRVYACAETYSEAVSVTNGVSMFGYFACASGWTVGSARAVVNAPSSPALRADAISRPTRIEGFQIVAPDVLTTPSASSYGAFVTSSSALSLVNDVIRAGAAASGIPGGVAAPPAGATPPCASSSGSPPGTTVTNGSPGTPQYTASGYVPASGSDGAPGANGDNGTAGGAGMCVANGGCSFSSSPLPHCNSSRQVCSEAGTSGCGGPGGAKGLGGTGGGASVALYAWNSAVAVSGGSLVAANAGSGGAGGSGQPAATSWMNSQGLAGNSATQTTTCSASPACQDTATNQTIPGGAAGGNGQPGWPGGSGASGSGGDSYSYVTGGGGTVSLSGNPTLAQGTAGTSPGPVAGAQGHAAAHN